MEEDTNNFKPVTSACVGMDEHNHSHTLAHHQCVGLKLSDPSIFEELSHENLD